MKKKNQVIESVEITDVAAEGKALARVNDVVMFVPYAAPGDVVDVEVYKKRRHYMEARVLKFHSYSDLRTTPFCAHFATCGGCKWQHIRYEEQLKFKRQQVIDHLERIGHLSLPEVPPTFASAKNQYYRNKLEYTFSNRRWLSFEEVANADEHLDRNALGFHIPAMFDRVLDIEHCYLQADPSDAIRLFLKAYALKNQLAFYDVRTHEGYLRNVIIRTSSTGDLMIIMIVAQDEPSYLFPLLAALQEEFPQISSLFYVINEKLNDSIQDLTPQLYQGNPYILEKMPAFRSGGPELQFRVGPKSFYQTNSEQAFELYRIAAEFADLKSTDVVYDLYTGAGTIAQFVAPYVNKVVGIEYVDEAIGDAKENAAINGITNTEFFAGDMAKVLTPEFVAQHGLPNLVICDPPRAGMHEKVVEQLLQMQPERIVYVSCNSATQARDIEWMSEKYRVAKVQAVDMFPHTHHVESVVLLEKK